MDGTNWTAASVVITALLGAGTLLVALQTMRTTRNEVNASAQRAESAARLAVDNNDQLVAAIGSVVASSSERMAQKGVRWSLAHDQGAIYRLVNLGGATALSVEVRAHPTMARFELRDGDRSAVGRDEALTFFAVPAWQTVDRTITVTWQDAEDTEVADRSEWKYPLPAKTGGGGD